ncbi:uncharacterized protein [Physcomitrium patens]|uniref:Uncharacterized protein n=1 Tax=Physcomitrium patens TaxID=3218 RepID=A0A2K1J2J1_PHYPA|nr:uncharacterized protein LOC112294310 [Physcomitrium patens]XP_024400371.1 uncharacterized protein LOC112294310 [Physcomitrium patens]PNR35736.1 hypothetical protein PHYPA_021586 [Physcomitrium patens]|eukprot:XP_024400369.1 uncharacterized protein LOC112294310 [Physcomitrella patens]
MGSPAEQANARIQSNGTRPKTCPAMVIKSPRPSCATPRTPRAPRISRTVPRLPLSNTIDPISRQVKYVDPNHRQCVPHNGPATPHSASDRYSGYGDQTHTSARTVRYTSGDIWAIPHHAVPTGYKNPKAWLKFDDLTSKNYYEKKVRKTGEEMDSLSKKLCAYSPNASRNLRRDETRTLVGLYSRDCRNASYLRMVRVKQGYFKTPMTTNQSYLKGLQNSTGFNNPVIFADKSKIYHRLQRRFN